MRISVRLPQVKPDEYQMPEECRYEGCDGRHYKPHTQKGEDKPTRDLKIERVKAQRWRCLKCKRTFRVYPTGVSQDQQSDRLKALSVLLYVLGVSYGGVSDVLEAMGVGIGKTTVYRNVQAAGVASRGKQRQERGGSARPVIGTDATFVKVQGVGVTVQVVVDDEREDLLGLDIIVSENEEDVLEVVRDIAEEVEAEVIISDDLDAYKNVADELALSHQVCRSHVKRNVDDLAVSISNQLRRLKEPVPRGVRSSPERLRADLDALQSLVRERPPDAPQTLKALYRRYQAAPPPKRGQRHTVWYRMRMLVTRLWENWPRLTLDQRRENLNGTNNTSERVIGWWVKERYRTMRGYKRTESIRNVATLTARMGARSGHYDMSELYL
jgi:transposase-like protein